MKINKYRLSLIVLLISYSVAAAQQFIRKERGKPITFVEVQQNLGLPAGMYFARIKNEKISGVKSFVVK